MNAHVQTVGLGPAANRTLENVIKIKIPSESVPLRYYRMCELLYLMQTNLVCHTSHIRDRNFDDLNVNINSILSVIIRILHNYNLM